MSEPADEPLDELERTLRALRPASAGLDRDRLFYEAGRASVRPRRRWLWPAATGCMTAVAASLLLALLLRPAPQPEVRFVHVPASPVVTPPQAPPEPEAPAPEPLPPSSYWRLHEQVVRHGLGALPPPAPLPPEEFAAPPAPPLTAWDWRNPTARALLYLE